MGTQQQTSIDKRVCPLGHGNLMPLKTWTLKARGGRTAKERERRKKATGAKFTHWKCAQCGYYTRTKEPLEA